MTRNFLIPADLQTAGAARIKLPLAAAFLLFAALPAQAEVYKWRDAQGQVNYSNVPPPSVARIATRVEDQISVIHPIDIKPASRAAAERGYAARAAQQTLAVPPRRLQQTITEDGYLPLDVDAYPRGAYGNGNDAYRQALDSFYRQSTLPPAPDAQAATSAPSQAANLQRAQAAETAQAQAANSPQQAGTAREAARVNADRSAAIQAGPTSGSTSGTPAGTARAR